jgi:hypothetical protein
VGRIYAQVVPAIVEPRLGRCNSALLLVAKVNLVIKVIVGSPA